MSERRRILRKSITSACLFLAGALLASAADLVPFCEPVTDVADDPLALVADNGQSFHPQNDCGPRPFRSLEKIVVATERAGVGRSLLALRDCATDETVTYTGRWDRVVTFDLNLEPDRFYQIRRITLLPKDRTVIERGIRIVSTLGCGHCTAAEACRFDVSTGNPLRLTRDGTVPFSFRNISDRPLRWTGVVTLTDALGHAVEHPYDVTVAASSVSIVRMARPLPAKGWWRVSTTICAEDGSTAKAETSTAWLQPRGVTSRLAPGKFRMGIHNHVRSPSPRMREMLLDALVDCGAKIVRVNVGTRRRVQPDNPNAWQWEADDGFVDAFIRRGIDIDALCWENPYWAASKDPSVYCKDAGALRRKSVQIWVACRPLDLKLSEDYFAALAARYRGRIAYYEIGNEWDLIHFYPGTIEDGVDILKSCARGLRRGDPSAVVSTCGFAAADSNWKMVVNTNIQERIVTEAKGSYDVHAVHLHGPYRKYRANLVERFFPMRKRLGVTAPWFSNETAASGVFGNETEVGEDVWKKSLFAWANGSLDYVWYNLRGTGWDPKDSEQGYGMLSADLKPRPSYAAFAALTALLNGFDYKRTLQSHPDGMDVFEFCGERDGRPVRVVAGWRNRRSDAGGIRFRTDAVVARNVDHMGNRRLLRIKDGVVSWQCTCRPSAIELEGATAVEPLDEDMVILADTVFLPVGKDLSPLRPADLELNQAAQVVCSYDANPALAHRTWKGSSDCSAKVWLADAADGFRIRAAVTDDIHEQHAAKVARMSEGDCLRLTVQEKSQAEWEFGFRLSEDGKSEAHCWVAPPGKSAGEVMGRVSFNASRHGDQTLYEVFLPLERPEALAVKIDDADGQGRDLWIGLDVPVRLREPKNFRSSQNKEEK